MCSLIINYAVNEYTKLPWRERLSTCTTCSMCWAPACLCMRTDTGLAAAPPISSGRPNQRIRISQVIRYMLSPVYTWGKPIWDQFRDTPPTLAYGTETSPCLSVYTGVFDDHWVCVCVCVCVRVCVLVVANVTSGDGVALVSIALSRHLLLRRCRALSRSHL